MSNNPEEPEYDYDEIFGDHIKEMKQKHEQKHSTPVNVKAKPQQEIDKDEQERNEQQLIHKELSKIYCICKHKQSKHTLEGYGPCTFSTTRFWKGKLQEMQCDCQQFASIEEQ